MIISISGKPGSGKSTVAQMLSEKLGIKRYYMGGIRREMAKEKGMTIEEFNELGEKDFSTDKWVDDYQAELGKKEDNFVIEGRTSFHFIPRSIKVFLDVSEDEGARRIFEELGTAKGQKRNEGKKIKNIPEMKKSLKERQESDKKRYRKYYGFDSTDLKHFDIVIDTTKLDPERVRDKIIAFSRGQEKQE